MRGSISVCCSVLQCVAVRCSVLQCVATVYRAIIHVPTHGWMCFVGMCVVGCVWWGVCGVHAWTVCGTTCACCSGL